MTDTLTHSDAPTPSHTKAQVLLALDTLQSLFPLEKRINQATPAQRQTYTSILTTWTEGRIPAASLGARHTVQELARLDALVVSTEGIGCYPFSAGASPIQVAFRGVSVYAMCAIDALAMARLVAAEILITSSCQVCGTPLACQVAANGALAHELEQAPRVIWQSEAYGSKHCNQTLCRHILFLCARCAAPAEARVYTLAQAAALGNAFFGFQRSLRQRTVDPSAGG